MYWQTGSLSWSPPDICQVVVASGHNFSSLTYNVKTLCYCAPLLSILFFFIFFFTKDELNYY